MADRRAWLFAACGVMCLGLGLAAPVAASPLLPQAVSLLNVDSGAHGPEGQARAGCPALPSPLSDEEFEQLRSSSPSRGVLLRIWHPEVRGAPPPDVDEHDAPPRESYLYALPPMALREWMVPGPEVSAAVAAVERVLLELDIGDTAVFDSLQAMARLPLGGAPSRPPVPPVLPEALSQALQRALDDACLDPPADWRPEMRALSLLTGLMRPEGHDPGYAIAGSIADLAESLGKPVAALETPERQIAPLLGESLPEVADRVRQTLEAAARPETLASLRRLQLGWDESVLSELTLFERRCNCRQSLFERRLWTDLEARNTGLAEQIASMHRRGTSVFAALGALQLSGTGGVIALLEAQGFQVQWEGYPRRPPATP
ncbi:TraB/GumN family protein [Leptothrix sp. BB-4]